MHLRVFCLFDHQYFDAACFLYVFFVDLVFIFLVWYQVHINLFLHPGAAQSNVTAVNLGPQTAILVWRYDAAPTVCLSLQTGPGGACAVLSLFSFFALSACCCCCARVMHLSPCVLSLFCHLYFLRRVFRIFFFC